MRQRVENLEAILTSADWELLADIDPTVPSDERIATPTDEVVSR